MKKQRQEAIANQINPKGGKQVGGRSTDASRKQARDRDIPIDNLNRQDSLGIKTF